MVDDTKPQIAKAATIPRGEEVERVVAEARKRERVKEPRDISEGEYPSAMFSERVKQILLNQPLNPLSKLSFNILPRFGK